MKDKKQRDGLRIEAPLEYSNSIIATLREPFLVLDKNLRVISANQSFYTTFKVTEKDTIGRQLHNLGNKQWNIPGLLLLLKKILPEKKTVKDYEIEHKFEQIGKRFMMLNACRLNVSKKIAATIIPRLEEAEKALILLAIEDITERETALRRYQDVSELQQLLLATAALEHKLKLITDSIVRIFSADFCRIWLIRPGDLCDKGCIHAKVREGPHVCRFREKCLHLVASSGRYTRIDDKNHARVPFGCYKIGRLASGEEHKFLTNDVANDPLMHNHEWARRLGLVSFAGYQLKVPGGETIGVLALFSKQPITSAEDAVLDGISVTAAFVAQQATAAEEVIQAQVIKTSSEIKSDFTGMVSHELRTPLAAIKEGVSLVLDKVVGNINEEQQKYLEIAKNNVDRLNRLINGVLDFQALESGKMEFKMEENDMNEAIKEIRQAMLPLAEKKNLDFVCQVDKNLPRIRFDHDKIIQVLTNLVNNALKFTEKGGITISASKGDNFIQVTVKDTGAGIKEEDMSKLFQQFTQLQRRVGGTGLGLSICKQIIEAHKGKIWANSEFGKGTSFYFVLPIKERRV